MTKTRQVRFYELGGAEVLKTEQAPVSEPGPGEIRLRVEAIGLNRAENLYRAGHYMYQPSRYPSAIGYEAAGTIEAVGQEVAELKPGDRVSTIPAFSMAQYGVFGETAIVPAYAVSRYPDALSPEEAASIWMQYVTAYGALIHHANLQRNQVALFTAATGGVGVAAIQMARQLGVVSIATTPSAAKRPLLESLKPDHIIATGDEDIAERVNAITGGRGVDLVWDAVGGSQFPKLVDATALGGQIITYGALAADAVNNTPHAMASLDREGYWHSRLPSVRVDLRSAALRTRKAISPGGLQFGQELCLGWSRIRGAETGDRPSLPF